MKKVLAFVLVACLSFSLLSSALATSNTPTFSDVPEDRWYYTWVTKAAQQGWVSGIGDGKFDPGGPVTHAQFALLLSKALYTSDIDSQPKGAQWWTVGCEVADRHGLFKGTDMERRSNWDAVAGTPIERKQMAQMMYNALVDSKAKLPSYDEYSEAALGINDIMDVDNYDAVASCYAAGLLNGNGNGLFDPQANMTRAQACVVLCNIYGYVTGDVVGTTNPGQTVEPVVPEKLADAVGGHYDITAYDVPADANKDGWITESEVQAVLNQLRIDYPTGSHWGSDSKWWSPVLGGGSECAGFAYMVSDKIFGALPAYKVEMEDTRVGDVLENGPEYHKNIVLNDYGKDMFEGVNYTDSYTTANGNAAGETVRWDMVEYYADWPTGTKGTVIYSRYPK